MVTENQSTDFVQFVDTCKECELFFAIEETAAFIRHITEGLENKQIPEDKIEGAKADLDNVYQMHVISVDATNRFGVKEAIISEVNQETGILEERIGTDYWKWYSHWNQWLSEFNDEKWDEFRAKLVNDEDLVGLLPEKKME